jgi:ribonucleoside-diphosphate reductase alpha chain
VLNIEKVKRKQQEGQVATTTAVPKLRPRERPEVVRGCTQKMTTGCGNLYVTINEDDQGIFELFTAMGKAGGCASSQAEAISRLISLSLRAGVDAEAIIRQLSGVRCPSPVWKDGELVLSCADAIARGLKLYTEMVRDRFDEQQKTAATTETDKKPRADTATKSASGQESAVSAKQKSFLNCPDCGGTIEHLEGCMLCRECGFSKCA